METTQYKNLEETIVEGDIESAAAEAEKLISAGTSPSDIFKNCIEPLLPRIGEQFGRLEIFLPEMMASADAVKAVQQVLLPHLNQEQTLSSKGKIVLATVAGDLHDIGKNIVKAMLEVNGFQVTDLGVDISAAAIITSAIETEADIIALSALMLPSLPFILDTIELSRTKKNERYNFKIMVGGGPVTEEWADKAGVAYGNDAAEAVEVARKLMLDREGAA